MKVSELAHLLEGLASGLSVLAKKPSEALASLQHGLRPFADQTVEQLILFLGKCEEFQRTGVVPSTGAAKKKVSPAKGSVPLGVEEATTRVRSLLADINLGSVTIERIDTLLREVKDGLKKSQLDELLSSLSIAGGARTKDLAVARIRQVLTNQLEMYVKSRAMTVGDDAKIEGPAVPHEDDAPIV